MLEKWETPRVTIQEFEPNEYVAACYNIKCNVDAANAFEKSDRGWYFVDGEWQLTSNYNAGQTHASDRCGSYGSYYVVDSNNDGKFESMIEISPDLGRLNCTLTNSDYTGLGSWDGISSGDLVYWTTTSGNRTWHHQGTVGAKNPNHPNRS